MTSSKIHKVFVYGTLKRGEPNHNWFSKNPNDYYKFIGNAQTIEKYPLIIATKYNIPFLLHSPGTGNIVYGEVYEVNENVFANLDILEEHPHFYTREECHVKCLDDDQPSIKTWIYFIKNFKRCLLKLKMLENYSSSGEHGLAYVTKCDRISSYNYKSEILL